MNKKLYPFLENIKGNWFLQENFYFTKNKKHKKCKEKISFLKKLKKVNIFKTDKKNILNINNYYIENINNSTYLFNIKATKNHLIVIKEFNNQKKIRHQEFIYIISNNFMISLTIIKNLSRNHYIGLKISSYIRLMQE
uniref:hypothetical protein Ycf58 n=1 Tax=Lophurella stichidiosa TaxID=2008659 RepID=UPI002551F66B|nr:hypothetical protein Ycf58 [Aphanocladia stichidiosa]WGH14008.1 hypothetical protein Ycf58 [Aphanocladia stichidiosa]